MEFDDEISDADTEVSDVGELRDLRKRAAEHGLGPEDSRKYGELLQAAATARAGKRAREAVQQRMASASLFGTFCSAAASQL
eukprot:497390-Pyramimonas_sp.AAC.1